MTTCYYTYIFFASSQGNCTITPLNSTTSLNAFGGGLAILIGTKNVTIQCNCTCDDVRVVDFVIWYDPAGTKLISSYNHWFDANVPYFTRIINSNHSNIILVIPIFNYSYNGTYTCGRRIVGLGGTTGTANAYVTFTIVGGLIINTECQLKVLFLSPLRLCMCQVLANYTRTASYHK